MKITKTYLKQVIMEELQSLNEAAVDPMVAKGIASDTEEKYGVKGQDAVAGSDIISAARSAIKNNPGATDQQIVQILKGLGVTTNTSLVSKLKAGATTKNRTNTTDARVDNVIKSI